MSDLSFSDLPQNAFIRVINGKGGKNRIVPFLKHAQQIVEYYLSIRPDSNINSLFVTFNPKHGYQPITRDAVSHRFQRISQQSGIEFSAHSLRHYRITQWANNSKIPIVVTQKWAGHSDLATTQKYIHIGDMESLQAAFE